MNIQRAYKTKLRPTKEQQRYFGGCVGAARYVYNWALADRIEKRKAELKTNRFEQKKRFNAIKDELCPWIRQYPYMIIPAEINNLDAAYQNFFRMVKQGAEKPGFPKFKKRGQKSSFTLRNIELTHIKTNKIKLSVIGWVNLAENNYFPTENVKINSVTISERAGDWFVSIRVEEEIELPETNGHVIGVDVGIKSSAVLSDGRIFDAPRTLYKYEKKLARLNRELARREKGGKNREKTKTKISKLYRKIADTRKHFQHNVSKTVVSDLPHAVVIEDLNVASMMQNSHLAKAVADAGMSEIHRQIAYKTEWIGAELVEVDMWYPSTQLCSGCGNRKVADEKLTLRDRIYICNCCGLKIDRDLNAARNLAAYGEAVKRGGLPTELAGLPVTVK